LILGLQACLDRGLKSVEIRLDSMLVVEQSKGNWRINEERLERRWKEVQELLGRFDYFRFEHIDRSLNQEADALSKLALRL
jgi:ribonuclease HI